MLPCPSASRAIRVVIAGIWALVSQSMHAQEPSKEEPAKTKESKDADEKDEWAGRKVRDEMTMAFSAIEDEKALTIANRILAKNPEDTQAKAVAADLNRRKKAKTFGRMPREKAPGDIEKWIKEKRIERLIEQLDQVCARQHGAPGGVDLAEDWRVDALIRIGEPAVPALIDVLEKDERLTRSVHWWRYGIGGNVLAVREAALTAVMSIIKVHVFEAGFTGDNFTARGEDAAAKTAKQLRDYWDRYGKFPYDERMMQIILDPAITGERLREAVTNLAFIDDEVRYGTTVWTDKIKAPKQPRVNPAIAKYSDPTAAEAIFGAMKRDLAAFDASKIDANMREYQRQSIEAAYADALAGLGDKRITANLLKEADTAAPRQRLYFSWAANRLGDGSGVAKISQELAAGKWPIDLKKMPDVTNSLLDILSKSGVPEAQSALTSLADPKVPYRKALIGYFATVAHESISRPDWIELPFAMGVLRSGLDDTEMTGAKWTSDPVNGTYNYDSAEGGGWGTTLAPHLKEAKDRLTEAPERICDQAAVALCDLILTLPRAHPLFRDNAARIEALKKDLARFKYRTPTATEMEALSWTGWALIPDIAPLSRAATKEDVAAGRAIFALEGKAKVASLKPPAYAVFKADKGKPDPRTALIVQAETDANGITKYGVLFRGGTGVMTAKELGGIKPLEPKSKGGK